MTDTVESKVLPILHLSQLSDKNFNDVPSTTLQNIEHVKLRTSSIEEAEKSSNVVPENQSKVLSSKSHKSSINDQQQSSSNEINSQKQLIKDHPLFPVMEYLLQKCEEATFTLGGGLINRNDLEIVLRRQFEIHGSLSSNDNDLDSLLLKTIQHLRYQHHELKKVDELCDHFLERYLSCLKAKITQETLLGWSDGDSDSCSPPEPSNNMNSAPVATIQTPSGPVSVTLFDKTMDNKSGIIHHQQLTPKTLSFASSLPQLSVSTSVINEAEIPCLIISASNGALCSASGFSVNNNNSINLNSFTFDLDSGDNDVDGGGSNSNGKPKRGSLPRRSVDLLRSWLYQHFAHPYPSEDEKRHLSKETGLNLIQVNNWFINARRRILQPLLATNERQTSPKIAESSSNVVVVAPTLKRSCSKTTKSKNSAAAAFYHWPEASIQNRAENETTHENNNNSASERPKKRRKKRKLLEKLDHSDHETSDEETSSPVVNVVEEMRNKTV